MGGGGIMPPPYYNSWKNVNISPKHVFSLNIDYFGTKTMFLD